MGRAAGTGARAPQPHAVDAGPVRGPDVLRGVAPFSVYEQGQHDVESLPTKTSVCPTHRDRVLTVLVVTSREEWERALWTSILKETPERWSQVSDIALLFYCGIIYCIAHIRSFLVYRDRFQQK